MSNPISEDCSSGLHEYCTPCECQCHEDKLKNALWCALIKVYDNYKTPLGIPIKCFKSRFCPKDQLWDNNRFIVWMEISNIDATVDRIGYLIPNELWKNFNIMIEYGDVPLNIKIDNEKVIERLMRL